MKEFMPLAAIAMVGAASVLLFNNIPAANSERKSQTQIQLFTSSPGAASVTATMPLPNSVQASSVAAVDSSKPSQSSDIEAYLDVIRAFEHGHVSAQEVGHRLNQLLHQDVHLIELDRSLIGVERKQALAHLQHIRDAVLARLPEYLVNGQSLRIWSVPFAELGENFNAEEQQRLQTVLFEALPENFSQLVSSRDLVGLIDVVPNWRELLEADFSTKQIAAISMCLEQSQAADSLAADLQIAWFKAFADGHKSDSHIFRSLDDHGHHVGASKEKINTLYQRVLSVSLELEAIHSNLALSDEDRAVVLIDLAHQIEADLQDAFDDDSEAVLQAMFPELMEYVGFSNQI